MNGWGQQQQKTNGGCVAALPDNPKRQKERLGSGERERSSMFSLFFWARQHNEIWKAPIICVTWAYVYSEWLPCQSTPRYIITIVCVHVTLRSFIQPLLSFRLSWWIGSEMTGNSVFKEFGCKKEGERTASSHAVCVWDLFPSLPSRFDWPVGDSLSKSQQ